MISTNELSTPVSVSGWTEKHSYPDYDCVIGNISTFLSINGVNPDLVLGSVLVLDAQTDPRLGTLTFRHHGDRQLQKATDCEQLTCFERASHTAELGHIKKPYVAIGDGFEMPWTPYYGKQHLEHGFLVLDERRALDPYWTITEFGEAIPCSLKPDQWHAVPTDRQIILEPGTSRRVDETAPARTATHDSASIDEYLKELQDGSISVDQLSTDAWIMSRGRRVNYRCVQATEPRLATSVANSAEAWDKASELAYIALRRERRGRTVPLSYVEAVSEALDRDQKLIEGWLA